MDELRIESATMRSVEATDVDVELTARAEALAARPRTTLRPLGDRLVVRRAKPPEREGSIYLPDTARKQQIDGEVVAVGNGRRANGKIVPLCVGVGDTVVFNQFAGTEIEVDGETLVMLREEDIFGALEGA